MSLSLSIPNNQWSFIVNNTDRHMRNVMSKSNEIAMLYSLFEEIKQLSRIVVATDSLIPTTLHEDKAEEIARIEKLRQPLIAMRNKILDNPFKYYNPFYQKKLEKIDAELDALDLQLYLLRSENLIKESELQQMTLSAEEKMRKHF